MIIDKRQLVLNEFDLRNKCIVVSGGFDPIHRGHIEYLKDAVNLSNEILNISAYISYDKHKEIKAEDVEELPVVCIVNCDDFLLRKKGFFVQNQDERAYIVDNLRWVDYVYIHESTNQFIHEALDLIKPQILAKGGDRKDNDSMPLEEIDMCEHLGIDIKYGIGGFKKLASSSEIVPG